MNRQLSLFIVACLLGLHTVAQDNNPLINSGETIQKGVKLFDDGKYKEAMKEFQLVKAGDTNYVWALYEMALTCATDSQFTRGITICEEALSLTNERERLPELLMQYGNLLDYAGQQERALHIYDSAMGLYPNAIALYVSKGTTYIRMQKYKEAENVFKQALLVNPYSASAHFKLGLAALNQGKIIEAYLCFLANLIMEPEGRFAMNSISLLDNMSKGKDDIVELVSKRTEEPNENFKAIEQIVLSKIALDKNYKSIIKLDDPICRQLQVIFEKLSFDENDKDFYNQFYIPFYKKLFDDKQFEYMVNHAFSGANVQAIKDFNKKNKKNIEGFVNETVEYFRLIRACRELQVAKRSFEGVIYYYQNGTLIGKGAARNSGKDLVGPWEFYYPAGNKKAIGTYNDKGEKEGAWKYYYFTGQVRGEETYSAGKQEGKETYYHDHGVVSARANYKNGVADGEHATYYRTGGLRMADVYRGGKLNGVRKNYAESGLLLNEVTYVDDKQNGPFKTYHANGKVESEGAYLDDKLNGPYKAWYDDGVVSMTAQYVADKPNGEMKKFHENGKLKSVENFVNGISDGEYVSYYDNGKVYTRYVGKKGKVDGEVPYYDKDGKQYSTMLFDNDRIKSAKYFDKSGKQIAISEMVKGRIDMLSYRPDGTKKSLVPYNAKGLVDGKQIYYYGCGKEREVDAYTEGELNGEAYTLHLNGQKKATTKYETGKKQGYYTSWYQHGGKEEEGWYVDDLWQGEWLTYNELGNLTARTSFLNSELNGLKTVYWPNGKKESDNLYDMGMLLEMTEYDTTGKAFEKVVLKNGSGKFTSRFVNGKLYGEGTYVNGNLQGVYKHYHTDGTVQALQYFKNGLRDSIYKSYHYGGKLYLEGNYRLGEKVGTWKYYRIDGTVSRVEEYKSGKLNGTRIYYFKNGKVETEIPFKNDDRDGVYKKYNEEGVLLYQLRYEEGLPLGYTYPGKNNELVAEVPLVQGNGQVNAQYANGNQSVLVTYVDGQQNGPYKRYYANGKPNYEDNEVYGKSEGVLKEFYSDGTPRSLYNYLHDNAHGPYKEYNEKGVVIEEGNYFNGEYHGETRFYDASGKLKETRTYYYGQLLSVK